jgi:hypothetical protein
MVVLYHSIIFWGGGWFSAYEPERTITSAGLIANWLNSFHVYCFILTSGYIYSFLRFEKGKYQQYRSFIRGKIKRLIVPYLFVSLVWAIPVGYFFYHYSLIDVVKNYLLGINPSQLWFLLVLFFAFAIVWPLSETINKSNIKALGIGVGFLAIGILGTQTVRINVFFIWTALQDILYFIIGMILRRLHREGKSLTTRWYVKWAMLIANILLFVFQWRWLLDKTGMVFRIANLAVGVTIHCLGAIATFLILQDLGGRINWDRTWFKLLVANSMIIYLFHQQIVYISIAVFNGSVPPLIHMMINMALAVVGSILIGRLLRTNQYTKLLVGITYNRVRNLGR